VKKKARQIWSIKFEWWKENASSADVAQEKNRKEKRKSDKLSTTFRKMHFFSVVPAHSKTTLHSLETRKKCQKNVLHDFYLTKIEIIY
jgi:hypothetical protein